MPDGYSELRKAFIKAILSSLKEETLSLNDELMNAAKEGDLESVKQLLNLGANVNAKTWNGYSPLGEALSGKSFNTAKFLIEKGADVNCKVIEYLGNDVGDYFITTPLSFACREKNLDMVKFLVDHGADVNAIGEDNMSPLSYACYWEQVEAVKYLIDHGADVNFDYKDPIGHNPLSIAKGKGNKELVNILLQNGAKE